MFHKLKNVKYRNSRLFLADYDNNVLLEATTFSELKRKLNNSISKRKFKSINLDPYQLNWIWFNHPLHPIFIEYRKTKKRINKNST